MDLILIGPGRAGMSVALAAVSAGHRVVAVAGRDDAAASEAAERLSARQIAMYEELPAADIALVAVRDDAIASVAQGYRGAAGAVEAAVHLSGLVPAAALQPFEAPLGSFHPLQTMPDAEAGAERLHGSWIAVTCDDDFLTDRLFSLAASLGARPFELDEGLKAVYHAAAAASANFPLAALTVAERLFAAAGVPFEAAQPLVRAIVDNAFTMGPRAALTGPIARRDVATVEAQVAAVRDSAPALADAFISLARATAAAAGVEEDFTEVLGR